MMGKGFGAVWTAIQSPHSNVRESKIVLDFTACMDCGFYAIGTWIQNTNLPTTTNMKKKERWFTKVYTLTVVKGGGGWNSSPEFLICCSISKRFFFK